MRRSTPLLLLLLACSLGASAGAEGSGRRGRRLYSIPEEHLADVENDPWMPCRKVVADGEGDVHGFCRLSCTAKWAYAPHRMDCEMLDPAELLKRSFGIGLEAYRTLSEDSFSKVNSGEADPTDPDVG